jgi:hypothetical protein
MSINDVLVWMNDHQGLAAFLGAVVAIPAVWVGYQQLVLQRRSAQPAPASPTQGQASGGSITIVGNQVTLTGSTLSANSSGQAVQPAEDPLTQKRRVEFEGRFLRASTIREGLVGRMEKYHCASLEHAIAELRAGLPILTNPEDQATFQNFVDEADAAYLKYRTFCTIDQIERLSDDANLKVFVDNLNKRFDELQATWKKLQGAES